MGNVFRNPEQRKHWNEYNKNYSKANYKTMSIKFHKEKDKDLLDYIGSQPTSVSETIKRVVREKINGVK